MVLHKVFYKFALFTYYIKTFFSSDLKKFIQKRRKVPKSKPLNFYLGFKPDFTNPHFQNGGSIKLTKAQPKCLKKILQTLGATTQLFQS
jgi:hypothetical protein